VTLLGECDADWEYYAGSDSCFYFSSTELTQSDARIECLSSGGDLPSIADQAEMDFIKANTSVIFMDPCNVPGHPLKRYEITHTSQKKTLLLIRPVNKF